MNREGLTTLSSLQEYLMVLSITLGGDTLIYVRDKDGLHPPRLCFERMPKEVPEDIVTIK